MRLFSLNALMAIALSLPAAAVPAAPATEVSGVTVTAGPGPKIATSFPADGSTVRAGVLALKIVFNQAMTDGGWSYAHVEGGVFPNCLGQPRMLADQRTFVLLCTVAPHQTYVLQINASPDFASQGGRTVKPTLLHFSTGDAGVFDMHAALTQAGLTDADEPIMRWSDPDAGKTQAAKARPDDEDDTPAKP